MPCELHDNCECGAKRGSEPAYPRTTTPGQWSSGPIEGLTKRERFAMAAMQGITSCVVPDDKRSIEYIAKHACAFADALLAELEKGDET